MDILLFFPSTVVMNVDFFSSLMHLSWYDMKAEEKYINWTFHMYCLTFMSLSKLIPDSYFLFYLLGFVNIYYLMLWKGQWKFFWKFLSIFCQLVHMTGDHDGLTSKIKFWNSTVLLWLKNNPVLQYIGKFI